MNILRGDRLRKTMIPKWLDANRYIGGGGLPIRRLRQTFPSRSSRHVSSAQKSDSARLTEIHKEIPQCWRSVHYVHPSPSAYPCSSPHARHWPASGPPSRQNLPDAYERTQSRLSLRTPHVPSFPYRAACPKLACRSSPAGET